VSETSKTCATGAVRRPKGRLKTEVFRTSNPDLRPSQLQPSDRLTRPAFRASLASLTRRTRYAAIPACGFLHCQSDCSGTECAFPRASWHKVEPCSVQSSPSAASWSSPIRPLRNNPQPHPHHCPQGLWLMSQPSPNFVRLATSAENQNGGREAICVRTDLTVRKDCVHTRTRGEPIAH